jgi:RNA polymerase sigma-70 factor (ECF subfamily)
MRQGKKNEEFTDFYNEHVHALMKFTLRRLGDARSCEDVVSETFMVAWRRWDDLPERSRERQWLYNVAFHLLSNQRRSRDRWNRLRVRIALEREIPVAKDDIDDLDVQVIREAIAQLRFADRKLLENVYWEKLTYREIANDLGVSENAVGIRLNRAKNSLRDILSSRLEGVWNETSPEEFEK